MYCLRDLQSFVWYSHRLWGCSTYPSGIVGMALHDVLDYSLVLVLGSVSGRRPQHGTCALCLWSHSTSGLVTCTWTLDSGDSENNSNIKYHSVQCWTSSATWLILITNIDIMINKTLIDDWQKHQVSWPLEFQPSHCLLRAWPITRYHVSVSVTSRRISWGAISQQSDSFTWRPVSNIHMTSWKIKR